MTTSSPRFMDVRIPFGGVSQAQKPHLHPHRTCKSERSSETRPGVGRRYKQNAARVSFPDHLRPTRSISGGRGRRNN